MLFCIIIIEMPFYRNLGAIRFEGEIQVFEIFSADPDTIIFQSRAQSCSTMLQSLAEYYQSQYYSNDIQFYQQTNKEASIVISQCRPAEINKTSIDDLCNALLKVTKVAYSLSSLFPKHIGDFNVKQFQIINGKLAFIYLPMTQIEDSVKRDNQLVKRILELIQQIKGQLNMSHKLLTKKISKCKNVSQVQQEINYFSKVYGVGTKSNKLNLGKPQKVLVNKNHPQLKLNLFKSPSKNKSSSKRLNLHSNSLHSSVSRKSNSFSLWDRNKSNRRNPSNSCSHRTSPFLHSKLNTIDLNSSIRTAPADKNIDLKIKANLKKCKVSHSQSIHSQVSQADQQKLLKKLQNSKKSISNKKMECTKYEAEKPTEKCQRESSKVIRQITVKQEEQSIVSKSKCNNIQSNIVSIKFPSKMHIDEPIQATLQPRSSSKAIHKNQSIHAAPQSSQPQKKLKKKPIVRQEQCGSQIQIVSIEKKGIKTNNPKKTSKLMSETADLNIPKIRIDTSDPLQQGQQTRKNSWNSKSSVEQTVRKSKKLGELLEKKKNLDYMGQTVVNTAGYLKNFEKIFWQLPMFFIYRSFYFQRVKLTNQLQAVELQQAKQFVKENEEIGQAVNKMIKSITKKLKKQDLNLLKQCKDFLNIEDTVNCEQAMKSFTGQYIQSLAEASGEYPELMSHYVQVINSYLISCGNKIDFSTLEKVSSHAQRVNYVKSQLLKLKKYL